MPDDAVVEAARAGDRAAMNELVRRYLPVVYSLVRQALQDDPDVDDVVQDIMVRVVRQLPGLRSPGSFRAWLTSIGVRQIGTHLADGDRTARRTVPLDTAIGRPDAGAEVESPVLLRAELAEQRRLVGHAIRWMGAEERAVYSLWWLETVGELTRPGLAAALGTSAAHAAVRIQRMREQLEESRRIVAALEAMPGCDTLGDVAASWDGAPTAYWRKRLGRHVRSCALCAHAAGYLLPTDRLLVGLVLLPVPAALGAAVLAKALLGGSAAGSATSVASGVTLWLSRVLAATTAHPVVATVSAGVLAVGIAVPTTGWISSAPPGRAVAVIPQRVPELEPPADELKTGTVALESAAAPGQFVAVSGDRGVLTPIGPASDAAGRERATLLVVPGLADPHCFSFRRPDGRYLRHSSFRLRLSRNEGTVLFRQDATFCRRAGFVGNSVSLESFNYRGFFLRHVGDQMWLDQYDGSAQFRADSSFLVRRPPA
jgi:RNA polymerase sigma factor (sigma-70 family)